MRKVFFISMVIGMCLVNAPAYCEDLPEPIKEMVLKDIGFYEPVTIRIDIGMGCAVMVHNPYELKKGVQPAETEWTYIASVNAAYADYWEEFLVNNGYLEQGKAKKPTDKLGLYGRNVRKDEIEIALAKRVLKSIDYTNKWKIQPENLDAWSFTFTYFFEPNLPELPRLDLIKASWNFKGQGTSTLNHATGKWQTRFPISPEKGIVGPQEYGSSLGDRDGFAYSSFIESFSLKRGGQFIKDNKLKGKMFNYGFEGVFITWTQEPDPNTGKTPQQSFMDGRAQAAYDRKMVDIWTIIMAGGPTVQEAQVRKHALTTDDYTKIGEWIGKELQKYNVWVVLMPAAQFDTPFVKGLDYNPNWQIVFYDNTQKLFVDIATPQGKALFNGVFDGKTLFPDDFTKNLIKARFWLLFAEGQNAKQQGLDFAFKAFNLNPSPAPLLEIVVTAANFAELKPRIEDFCKNYVEEFVKRKDEWMKQDGYRNKSEAARIASMYLLRLDNVKNNDQLKKFYSSQIEQCINERNQED